MAVNDTGDSGDSGPELIASEVDELTHAELLCLYRDAEENIRFSKQLLQNKTLPHSKLILVPKPYMERRTFATFLSPHAEQASFHP